MRTYRLGMRENGSNGETAGALDVHEERAWSRDKSSRVF